MMRPLDNILIDTPTNFTTLDPIIPYGVFAVNADGSGFKLGDGINTWSNLTYQGSSAIRNKQVQSSREPLNNELLVFCDSTDKWIYRLQHCFDTIDNWESNNSVFPTSTLLVETANLSSIPTGRFKIGDGATTFDALPWFGTDFATGDFSVGQSIEFNGSGWDPVTYLQPTQLQVATIPVGKFHKDDGTWAYITEFNDLESITATNVIADTVYIGFPTESSSVTLTSDGVDLFSDGNKVWTEYNDGVGSGLDADTLAGHAYTYFATTGDIETLFDDLLKIELTADDPYIKFTSPLYDAITRLSSTGLTIEHGDCTLENYIGIDTIQSWIGYGPYTVSADITNDIPMIYVSDESGSENKASELYCDKLQLKTDTTVSAEFSTTGITIGTGRCPIYWGELASAPTTFSNGDEYYNTGDSKFYKYNGTDWIALN